MKLRLPTRQYVFRFLKATNQLDDDVIPLNKEAAITIIGTMLKEQPRKRCDVEMQQSNASKQPWRKMNVAIYVEIPKSLIKNKKILNEEIQSYAALNFANFIKRRIHFLFIEHLKLHFVENNTSIDEGISLFYQKYDLDEDTLPSASLRKQWQRKKDQQKTNEFTRLINHRRHPQDTRH